MASKESTEPNEAQLAVHWKEEELYQPPESFVAQANLKDPAVFERFSEKNFPDCYKEYADLLTWYKPWTQTLDTSDPPFWKWFVGGEINACYNCVDRHLAKNKNKTALHFVPEPENEPVQHITYQELWVRVNEFAALLRDFCGLKRGDRVTLHLPMTAELPITMLACARLGVIHSQVFSGFSGQACGERIADSQSRVLVTMDSYYRAGKLLDHKKNADIAVDKAKEEDAPPRKGAGMGEVSGQVLRRDTRWSKAAISSSTIFCPSTRATALTPSTCSPRTRSSSCTPAGARGVPRPASTARAATCPT